MPLICRKLRVASSSFLRSPRPLFGWHHTGMDIRDRIRATIEANPELSVRGVSLAAGLSDSALGKFLKGDTDSITLRTAERLADALGVDQRWLIFGEGDPDFATDISRIVERIPESDREQALRVLRTFARTGTDG